MDHADTTWRDAFLMAPGRIAGIRVRPLSAWHCHVAQMLDIRMWLSDDNRLPTPSDIMHSVAVCRSSYRLGHIGVPAPGWFVNRIWLPLRWRFRDWRKDAYDLVDYWTAYQQRPTVLHNADKMMAPLGCPPYIAVAIDVCMMVGTLTLEQALNLPLSQLHVIRSAACELSGGPTCAWRTAESPDFISEQLKKAQEAINRNNAKLKEAANA